MIASSFFPSQLLYGGLFGRIFSIDHLDWTTAEVQHKSQDRSGSTVHTTTLLHTFAANTSDLANPTEKLKAIFVRAELI